MAKRRLDADRKRHDPAPREPEKLAWLRAILPGMIWLAAGSIAGLALVELSGVDATILRWVFMAGIGLAGTVAMIVQAQRPCPQCGRPFGYRLSLFKAGTCRRCGAEFPAWPEDR